MSTTVDERVVEMRFDNGDFEKKVSTTMSTLDKFKQKLNLTGASKGLENINAAAGKVNMSPLGSAVETVHAKFSALEVMGVTALANITNSAVNAGKRIVSALTIDPVKSGYQEYETQMNAVQTILANTQKEGTNVKIVNAALDELNEYADKTIYNFTEMTRNIGTFTAAGVKLDTSVSSIKGIANLAAVSGSSSQQASTAMYQLSQAIASGTVKLTDWNSVVNAGMGGQVFQDALVRTSEHLQTGAKAAISAEGSFRDSLSTGWLTTEVLTQTLDQFATAADTQEEYEAAVKKFVDQGYSQEEAKQMADMARTAGEAATKVKTFTQLIDTLKEALGSGWAQTWRLIVGDFEEAKELWTEVSDVLSGLINNSSEARNNMLQGWADLGGRKALIESLWNSFDAISKILKPIGEAFREVFPRTTSEQLYKLTDGFRKFTERLIISDETAGKLKRTFKGLFSALGIVVDAIKSLGQGADSLIKNFTGIDLGILDVTASIGDWLSNLRKSTKETNIFGKAIENITGFISKVSSKIKESFSAPDLKGVTGVFKGIWEIIKQVSSGIVSACESVTSGIAKAFGGSNIFEVINNGLLAGILVYVGKFVKDVTGAFDEGAGVLENIKGILDDVRGCFKAYQDQLKAGTLLKIASSIGILAASLWVISTIDCDALARALGGITVLFVELMGALAVFNKMNAEMKGGVKAIPLMIGMSVAVLILAGAMKKLSSLNWEGIAKGLVGVGALLTELSIFLRTFKFDGKLTGVAVGIVILSSAILILAKAVKNFGSMKWDEIGKGLAAIGALLAELAVFTRLTGNAKHVVSTGLAMVLLGESMKIFASSVKDFSKMSWSEIGRGLTAMAGALAEVSISMNLMPKGMISISTGLVIASSALKIMASSLSDFSGMSWEEIGRSLTAMGLALAELAIALNLMKGTLSGSAALIIAAGALAIITPVLKSLGSMSWESIAKGLVALAGAFTVIGVAGALLSPMIPAILGLAAAFTLFGVATLGIGAGLLLIATGITALASSLSFGVTAIVAGLSAIVVGISDLIPTVARKLGEGVVEFAKVIGEYAPQLAEAFLQLIYETLNTFATYTPKIVDSLTTLIIGIINSLADNIPELIVAVVNFLGKFFEGIVAALNGIDTTNLLKAILAVGLMTIVMHALSGIVMLIPSAMAGMIGVGLVIAEMALVLAAIGGLAQIPGLKWLIDEGGDLLQSVGTAIGKFIGGIVGGVAEGATSSLPNIADNLSSFMTNIQPFIEGAKNIDSSSLDGVTALGKAILILTAADILDGIASFITGGSSLSDFAEELVPFGKAMKEYSDNVSGIDTEAVTASANAAEALSELASGLPNSGGLVSWFTGDNELVTFAEQLKPFGKAMKEYSDSVNGLNPRSVTASSIAAKSLSELANNLPNTGGLVSWFAGDNKLDIFAEQLKPFGKAMKEYSDSVKGIDSKAVTSSANAAKSLSELANNLPNSGGLVSWFTGDNKLDSFASQLKPFGKAMKEYSDSVSGIDSDAFTSSANAAKTLSELANNLPNSGGLVSLFTGDNSLFKFGAQLAPFGKAMKDYADAIDGIDTDAVTSSANAAKTLSELANNLPNSGGLVSLFTGDNGLFAFGAQLAPFGECVKSYADSVEGIEPKSVTASANAARTLAKLYESLPEVGGLSGLLSGDESLSKFGYQLVPFGECMKSYADSVKGLDVPSVTESTKAAEALFSLANELQNGGGIVSLFNGDTNLASLGLQLVPFGEGLKRYGDSVAELNTENITNSATAANALVGVANSLSSGSGLIGLFTGKSNLSTLALQLVPFGEGLKKYSDSVSDLDVDSITGSATAANELVKVANSLSSGSGLIGLFTGKSNLSTLALQLVPFGGGLKEYSNAVSDLDVDSITRSATAAEALKKVVNSLSDSGGGILSVFTGKSNLASIGLPLVPFGKCLKSYSNEVNGINVEGISGSAKVVRELVSLVKSVSGLEYGGVNSFKDAINTLAETNVSGFVKTFDGLVPKISNIGSNLNKAFAQGFKANQSATEAVKTVVSNMQKAISGKSSSFNDDGKTLIKRFASGLNNETSTATKSIKSMLSSCASAISDYKTKFYNAGSNLVSGFANGINDSTWKAEAKAKTMAEAAEKAAKDALDINSPSKVFIRLGYRVPEGFAQGIERMSKYSSSASESMADDAIINTKGALARMLDVINSDIDAQPTIRPVLDLSDVTDGANSINGMFSMRPSVGLLTDVGAINSMMNNKIQNGGNSDVISAIKDLKDSISNSSGNVYSINGITYDDGSNVSNAVEALMRAARMERRI